MSNTRALALKEVNVKIQRRLRHLLNPAPEFTLHAPGAAGRGAAESFVKERFRLAHGATIRDFMPALISMRCNGHMTAVAGIRAAQSEELFLEKYLDEPVETLISRSGGEATPRHEIAEIGNLVATEGGSSYVLFLILAALLDRAGFRSVVFTATPHVRGIIDHLGFETRLLCAADPHKLGRAARREWGRYYATRPLVVHGSAADAMRRIQQRKLLAAAVGLFRPQIDDLAGRVRGIATDHGTFAFTA